jgi:membrane protease YdiL (CAAX protease family)
MTPPDSPNLPAVIIANLELPAIVACGVVWAKIALRWLRRQPVLPYQPRRPVPWRAFDVVLIASLYIFSQVVVLPVAYKCFDLSREAVLQAVKAAPLNVNNPMSRAHPLARVLAENPDVWMILLCVVSAVIVAPIAEELIFRLVVQGWLERVERRLRRRISFLRGILAGVAPVTTVAILFAAMHGREAGSRIEPSVLVFLLAVQCMANVLTVVLSVCWLRFAAGATLADFGIVPSKMLHDLRTAGVTFLAVTVPVLATNVAASELLPRGVVSDPIPIFFLAIALGILYYRTHRIVPSLALHMAFNAVGVFIAIAMAK